VALGGRGRFLDLVDWLALVTFNLDSVLRLRSIFIGVAKESELFKISVSIDAVLLILFEPPRIVV